MVAFFALGRPTLGLVAALAPLVSDALEGLGALAVALAAALDRLVGLHLVMARLAA